VVSCIRCRCAEGWHTGYDGPCLNAGCRCRAYEPDWAALDALAVEDVLDAFPAPGVTFRHLRPASRAVAAHLVELTEPPFYWPLDHQPQHAAEGQRDERLLAEREEAGSRPADRTGRAPLAQWIVRQPSELVDGSSNLSGGAKHLVLVAQTDSAAASGAAGRWFEPTRGHKPAGGRPVTAPQPPLGGDGLDVLRPAHGSGAQFGRRRHCPLHNVRCARDAPGSTVRLPRTTADLSGSGAFRTAHTSQRSQPGGTPGRGPEQPVRW
jgi:hypothetical protein